MAPRKPKYPFPLVEIKWWDAQTAHGWEEEETIEVDIPLVTTIGFLIKDTDKGVTVASSICADKQSNARISIPLGMIVERRML
jgi:hypothetical protein